MNAAENGNIVALKNLIKHGANQEYKSKNGKDALYWAKYGGKTIIISYLKKLKENGWVSCSDNEVDKVSYIEDDGIQIRDRFNLRAEERTKFIINLETKDVTTTVTKFSDIGNAELQVAAEKLEEFTGNKDYSKFRTSKRTIRHKKNKQYS